MLTQQIFSSFLYLLPILQISVGEGNSYIPAVLKLLRFPKINFTPPARYLKTTSIHCLLIDFLSASQIICSFLVGFERYKKLELLYLATNLFSHFSPFHQFSSFLSIPWQPPPSGPLSAASVLSGMNATLHSDSSHPRQS